MVDGTLNDNPGGRGIGFVFSPDGSRWAAQTDTRVIVDNAPQKTYTSVPGKGSDVPHARQTGPAVAFSPDGKHVAYLASQDTRIGPDGKEVHDPHAFLVVDGKELKEWAAVGTDLFWSADNRTVGYVATPKGKAAVVVVGDKEWPAFDETTPLGFSPDGLSFAARVRHTEQQSVVLDGRRRGPYEEIGLGGSRVGFTPDGKVTYFARKDGNAVVWVEELRADLPDGGPLLAATPKGGDPAGGGWVPLFNGRDLANWKFPDRSEDPTLAPPPPNKVKWAVVNGAITFTGRDTSHLETVGQEFRRFHLRAEIKTRPGTRTSFAGVVIDNSSTKWRTGSMVDGIDKRGDGVTEKAAADGEWFTLEVLATGDRTVTRVNGKRVAELKTPDGRAGPLRFTVQNDYQVPFEVRKIEYRPQFDDAELVRPGVLTKLPQDPVAPAAGAELLAPVAGFTPLFNGKDTAGWETDRQGKEWEVRDGKLYGAIEGGFAAMYTTKEYRDFHLRAVLKSAVGAKALVMVRAKGAVHYMNAFYGVYVDNAAPNDRRTGALTWESGGGSYPQRGRPAQAADGQWTLLEVIAKGRQVVTKVNGELVTDFSHDPIKLGNGQVVETGRLGGRIGLLTTGLSNGSPVEFGRLDIRELK